jgi:CheY-like chemotaxis protein
VWEGLDVRTVGVSFSSITESLGYYREVLTVVLLSQGFVVHAFADGASLLGSLATAVDADLAVLDWDLPKMPGIKLLAELRRHGVNLPVVFLTGKSRKNGLSVDVGCSVVASAQRHSSGWRDWA